MCRKCDLTVVVEMTSFSAIYNTHYVLFTRSFFKGLNSIRKKFSAGGTVLMVSFGVGVGSCALVDML